MFPRFGMSNWVNGRNLPCHPSSLYGSSNPIFWPHLLPLLNSLTQALWNLQSSIKKKSLISSAPLVSTPYHFSLYLKSALPLKALFLTLGWCDSYLLSHMLHTSGPGNNRYSPCSSLPLLTNLKMRNSETEPQEHQRESTSYLKNPYWGCLSSLHHGWQPSSKLSQRFWGTQHQAWVFIFSYKCTIVN